MIHMNTTVDKKKTSQKKKLATATQIKLKSSKLTIKKCHFKKLIEGGP